jgi:hypothetical protein
MSSVAATLFGYGEFILREISPETLLATAPSKPGSSRHSSEGKGRKPLPLPLPCEPRCAVRTLGARTLPGRQ